MKSFILFLTLITTSSAYAEWRQWMECVVMETVNGVETRMDPNPTIDFGYVGHGVLFIKGERSLVTAEISGADSNMMITAHDQVTGANIVSHSMGVGAVAIMKFTQGGRKMEISCYVGKQN
jgi:hypothetical protein